MGGWASTKAGWRKVCVPHWSSPITPVRALTTSTRSPDLSFTAEYVHVKDYIGTQILPIIYLQKRKCNVTCGGSVLIRLYCSLAENDVLCHHWDSSKRTVTCVDRSQCWSDCFICGFAIKLGQADFAFGWFAPFGLKKKSWPSEKVMASSRSRR